MMDTAFVHACANDPCQCFDGMNEGEWSPVDHWHDLNKLADIDNIQLGTAERHYELIVHALYHDGNSTPSR